MDKGLGDISRERTPDCRDVPQVELGSLTHLHHMPLQILVVVEQHSQVTDSMCRGDVSVTDLDLASLDGTPEFGGANDQELSLTVVELEHVHCQPMSDVFQARCKHVSHVFLFFWNNRAESYVHL